MGGVFFRRTVKARADANNDISADLATLFRILQRGITHLTKLLPADGCFSYDSQMDGEHYLFFFLNDQGYVGRRLDLECHNDEAALDHARKLRHVHGVEVWKATQMIGKVAPLLAT